MADIKLPDGLAIPRKTQAPRTGPKPRPQAPPTAPGGWPGGGGGASPESEKKLSMEELAAQYGYAAAFFKSDPELEKLIKKAVKEQWSVARFQAEFQDTDWYREHSAAVRTWMELEARDPSEAQRRINEQSRAIRAEANRLGISLSGSRAKKMARDALMLGWSAQLITDAIVDEFNYRPGQTSGETAFLETFIRRSAHDFGVQIGDDRVGDWLSRTLRGDFTEENLVDLIRDMAKSRYPGLVEQLDRGLTVADVAEPYRQSYSNILEQDIDSVSLFDPLIQKALQGTTAPAGQSQGQGQVQTQSLFDFERALRQDSRWQYTKNAHQSTVNATLGVLRDWGLYG